MTVSIWWGKSLAVLAVLTSVACGGDDPDSLAADPEAMADEGMPFDSLSDVGAVGEPLTYAIADGGELTITVNGVKCSTEPIESLGVPVEPEVGKFCHVGLTLANTGRSPALFLGSNSLLLDSESREFSLPFAGVDQTSLQPTQTADTQLVFDVAEDSTPASVLIHDDIDDPAPLAVDLTP
jgi:hypothetical protein